MEQEKRVNPPLPQGGGDRFIMLDTQDLRLASPQSLARGAKHFLPRDAIHGIGELRMISKS
jgi:hypothetical protein